MKERSKKLLLRSHLRAGCAIACLLAGTVSAAVPPGLFAQYHWRSIGPYRGGRVLTVQGAPDNPSRFYFGAVNGGVWRTDNAGRTWQPIFDAGPVGSIGALAVAPSAPQTIYVGTGEADMRSDVAQGAGLFRTTDGGAHWSTIGLQATQQIGRILVDPRHPDVLLVAALGHPYDANPERGVFRSEDGGNTWAKTLFHDADTGAIDLAFEPGNPDTIYAALWQTRRPPWSVYPPSSGPGSGLYKSTDNGRTWTKLTGHGLPDAPARIGIATTPANSARIYALIDTRGGAPGRGLYRSDDHGANWRLISSDKRISERAWYFSGITAEPRDADTIYVCDTIVLRSTDGGAHFTALKGDPTGDDFHTLWIDPAEPARRMLGVDQGALVSLDSGATWSSWFNQPTAQFYHVSTDNRFPYRVYGAQQDSGAASVSSRAADAFDGIGMQEFHETAAGGESDNIAPDPNDPDSVFGGRVDRLDVKTGQLHSRDPTLAFPETYRGTWTLPLSFSPDGRTLYFANQRVFGTTDQGAHWQPISPDLTRPNPPVPATLDATTASDVTAMGARRGVIYAVAPSPKQNGLIWAGTDDGLVWRTEDGGAHWSNATPSGLLPWSKIGIIEASHADAATAYLAVDRHRLGDQAPYIYRTRDAGAHWSLITDGLPHERLPGTANVVREDPTTPNLLFAGTEEGAYVSFDAGDHWQPLQAGLPHTSVRDMTLHGDDLVIATHGRGFYVLDDIAALRELAVKPSPDTQLFPLATAIRLHPSAFTGTPMPKDEPMAPNPPDGAMIDYKLAAPVADPVQIEIDFPDGTQAARFSSADKQHVPDAATLPIAPEWVPATPRVETSAGAHRFIWDLRLPQPDMLQGGDPPQTPILAPPGEYTVILHVGAVTFRQKLSIVADPREHLPDAAFQAQFALARQIQAAQVQAHVALLDAAKLRDAAHDDTTKQSGIALIGAPTDGLAGAPPTVSGLTAISARLDALANAVGGADGAPMPDAVVGFGSASAALQAAIAHLNGLKPH